MVERPNVSKHCGTQRLIIFFLIPVNPSLEKPINPRVRQLALGPKSPLEKSHSLPDMQNRTKKKQRMIA